MVELFDEVPEAYLAAPSRAYPALELGVRPFGTTVQVQSVTSAVNSVRCPPKSQRRLTSQVQPEATEGGQSLPRWNARLTTTPAATSDP
jgi:hypothetical protein